MPKSTDKGKSRKRPKPSTSGSTNQNENEENQEPKKKKVQKKPRLADGIEKSKQLSQKVKTPRLTRSSTKKDTAPRLCGNGKPMPALAELERMYDDSQDESDSEVPTTKPSTATIVRPSTPSSPLKIPEDKLLSPRTLNQIASKMMARLDSILETDTPPPPVIPPKKRKKTGIPHIVGCKEREQVPWAPAKNSFCVGDPKYGVEKGEPEPEDECCPKKRCKRSSKLNISKSIFNAKSDEISARLQECENSSPGSSDSNRTVDYDYMNTTYAPRPFSPLPSTSKDNETILKNEQLFNESFNYEQNFNTTSNIELNDSQNDLEIIETPVEIITINDSIPFIKPEAKTEDSIASIKPEPKTDDKISVPVEDDDLCMIWPDNNSPNNPSSNANHTNDDSCVIIEPDIIPNNTAKNTNDIIDTIEIKDEFYGSLDLTQPYDTDDICEVIDLDADDVIAETNAILEKFNSKPIAEVTTVIEPCSRAAAQNTGHRSAVEDISNKAVANSSNVTNAEINRSETIQSTPAPLLYQPSTPAPLPSQPSTPQGTTSNAGSISDVVHNFFNSRNSADSTQTVDLTTPVANPPPSPSRGLMDVVMSMLQCVFTTINDSTRPSGSVQRTSNQVTPVNLSQANNVSNAPNINRNINSSASSSNIDYMQYLRRVPPASNRGRKSKKNNPIPAAPPVMTTPTIVDEPDNNNTTTRNLGDCPICMESLSKSAVASTLCGHIFCLSCIKAAIRSNGKRCPNCRKVLKGVGYHQIYI